MEIGGEQKGEGRGGRKKCSQEKGGGGWAYAKQLDRTGTAQPPPQPSPPPSGPGGTTPPPPAPHAFESPQEGAQPGRQETVVFYSAWKGQITADSIRHTLASLPRQHNTWEGQGWLGFPLYGL